MGRLTCTAPNPQLHGIMAQMLASILPADPASLTAPPGQRRSLLRGRSNPLEVVSPHLVWAMLQATIVIGVLLLVSGAGRPAVALEGRGDPAAAHAVEVLISTPSSGAAQRAQLIAAVPADYVSVMGYRPSVIDINGTLSLAKPIGECSSPVQLAFDMEPTCKGHDFGYDLLRYAAAIDAPLGKWARPLIDQWWYAEMHQRCDLLHTGAGNLACHGQVLATQAIINVNSWREGNGPPIEENPWRYLGALALTPFTLLAVLRLRRGDPHEPHTRLQAHPAVPAFAH